MTYDELKVQARKFLGECGALTIEEIHNQTGEFSEISVNEMLGMGTRVLAEVALEIQQLADAEEGPKINNYMEDGGGKG